MPMIDRSLESPIFLAETERPLRTSMAFEKETRMPAKPLIFIELTIAIGALQVISSSQTRNISELPELNPDQYV